jgi:CheY-like chemotaxis protein
MKILLITVPAQRSLFEDQLQALQHDVTICTSASRAVDMCAQMHYPLIIFDSHNEKI